MFSEVKHRLLVARAEGALALAEVTLEQGQAREALRLCLGQARDLSRRGVMSEVTWRAWFGALGALSRLVEERAELDLVVVPEIMASVAGLTRPQLPSGWRSYDALRPIIAGLLAGGHPAEAEAVAQVAALWFNPDPRPRYALGRALEAQLTQAAPAAAEGLARRALVAFQGAQAAALEVGAGTRWTPVLSVRMARLIHLHLAPRDPARQDEALKLVEALDRPALRSLGPHERFAVACVWLHASRAMLRLRALDALEGFLADPAWRSPAREALMGYLERLDWGFYPTEQDRVRALLATWGDAAARQAVASLDLMRALHDELGRHSAPERGHLVRLLEAELGMSGEGTTAARYYRAALALCDGLPLADALEVQGAGQGASVCLDSSPGIALACLQLRAWPSRTRARSLLDALSAPAASAPQLQGALALAMPVLLAHWTDWSELQVLLRRAVGQYLLHAPAPACGFAALGARLAELGEDALSRQAAGRALAGLRGEPEVGLQLLLLRLADQEAGAGHPEAAVSWLLPLLGAPDDTDD